MLSADQIDKIHNIVIVMMENRSFDHALGYLSLPESLRQIVPRPREVLRPLARRQGLIDTPAFEQCGSF